MRILGGIAFFSLLFTGVPVARGDLHDYDRPDWGNLQKSAPVVVVAHLIESKASADKAEDMWRDYNPVNSTFAIELVLKGDVKSKTLTLFHYQDPLYGKILQPAGVRLAYFARTTNGGMYVHYLLFLAPRADGRFMPAEGQAWAGYSVFLLSDLVTGVSPQELTIQPATQPAPK
ncbi:MAG TPA: hypothetical protein VH370_26995 [Humisphaera sp.]|jgi:hypothetical protein|nr:hypothetical protein [Humisphaera sp.]